VQAWQALSLSFFADITFKTSTTDNQAELQVLDEVEVGLVRTTKQTELLLIKILEES